MGRHSLLRAILAAALAFGAVLASGATPAMAEASITAAATDLATIKRDMVRRLALENPVPEVSADAWSALLSNRGDEAINEFLVKDGGWAKALKRAQQRIDMNNWYVNDIYRFAIPGSNVHHEAKIAVEGGDNEKDHFVRVAYEKAKELDRINDNKRDERLARLSNEDRDYVTYLAEHDPGLQVKVSARRALEGGDDASIGLFFKYYWAIGAKLDDERFRTRTQELNQAFLLDVEALRQAALAAEAAEREASGELARKHRQDAIANWEAADRAAEGNSVDWLAEKARSDENAAAWLRVAEYARTAQSEQDWNEVIRRAGEGNASWQEEAAEALRWADTWKAMAAEMRKKADEAKERTS
ncbi:hypothetical protein [Lentzea sp. NPDC003310]|uniref:hypothetical protein n=1 Tax=Lentzea sp. NPDC003310 TaxID=3154447 RepID=UPI00339F09D8